MTTRRPSLRPLEHVATIERDAITAGAIKDGTLFVGLEHIDSTGEFVGVKGVEAGQLASNKFWFGPQHILFGKLRPYLKKTARPDFEGICSTDIVPILPGPEIDRDYLFHFLRHPKTVEQAVLRCAGANLPRLSPRDLATFEVPVPPVSEQRRIADILDKADAIRRKRKEAIALTEELLRSAFLEMFGDPVTNPKGWPVQELNDFISPDRPITYGILKPGPDVPDGVPYVRVVDIKGGLVNSGDVRRTTREIDHEYRRSRLRPGDLLMSIRGHVGRLAVVPSELDGANITQDTARIAPVGLEPTFLMNLLETEAIQFWMFRHVRGVAVRGINIRDVRRIPLPVPPPRLQACFAALAETTIQERSSARGALDAAAELFSSLVARAFSNRLASECGSC